MARDGSAACGVFAREANCIPPDGGMLAAMANDVPTLHSWVGGTQKLEALFERFYEHVRDDAVLAPIFAGMNPEHHKHVAAFVAEVFGGPHAYSEERGGHAAM